MTTDWTPDQPLRTDATDEQILARSTFIFHEGTRPAISIVRELHAATVAEYEAKLVAENKSLLIAINWLMGCGEDCSPPTASDGRAPAPFWWRSEFSARAVQF